jgi:hypothetical protein
VGAKRFSNAWPACSWTTTSTSSRDANASATARACSTGMGVGAAEWNRAGHVARRRRAVEDARAVVAHAGVGLGSDKPRRPAGRRAVAHDADPAHHLTLEVVQREQVSGDDVGVRRGEALHQARRAHGRLVVGKRRRSSARTRRGRPPIAELGSSAWRGTRPQDLWSSRMPAPLGVPGARGDGEGVAVGGADQVGGGGGRGHAASFPTGADPSTRSPGPRAEQRPGCRSAGPKRREVPGRGRMLLP